MQDNAESLWTHLFENPGEWYDHRAEKDFGDLVYTHPDFRYRHRQNAPANLWREGAPSWALEKLEEADPGCNDRRRDWEDFFADPSSWFDHRQDKAEGLVVPEHPDFVHSEDYREIWLESAPHTLNVQNRLEYLFAEAAAAAEADGAADAGAASAPPAAPEALAGAASAAVVPGDAIEEEVSADVVDAGEPGETIEEAGAQLEDASGSATDDGEPAVADDAGAIDRSAWSENFGDPALWRDVRYAKEDGHIPEEAPDFVHVVTGRGIMYDYLS